MWDLLNVWRVLMVIFFIQSFCSIEHQFRSSEHVNIRDKLKCVTSFTDRITGVDPNLLFKNKGFKITFSLKFGIIIPIFKKFIVYLLHTAALFSLVVVCGS